MTDMIPDFRGFEAEDFRWIQPHLSLPMVSDMTGIVAEIGGKPAAACILHSWTYTSVMAHILILKPIVLRYKFIEEVMEYVFIKCGRRIMLGSVPGTNKKALAFDKHVGFVEIARVPDGFNDGVDMVLIELRKENCRWLKDYERRQEGQPESAEL